MVDAITKEAMCKLMAGVPSIGATLSSLIGSPNAAVQERALTLCSNMCGGPELRRALVGLQGVLSLAAAMACGSREAADSGKDHGATATKTKTCLLYTSDAADE